MRTFSFFANTQCDLSLLSSYMKIKDSRERYNLNNKKMSVCRVCLATALLLLLAELSCRTTVHFSHLSNPRIGNWRVAKANGLEVRNVPIISLTDNTYS